MSEAVRLHREGRVGTLTLDRPPLNVLDLAALESLDRQLGGAAADGELQVLVVRGAGERAFSAGVAVEDHTPDKLEAMLAGLHGAIRRLQALPAITVAVVRGHCLGGGMELAAACDLLLAAEDARFGQPEVRLGCFPPVAAALLPRRVGSGRALELLLTGRTVGCEEAERLGVVTHRVPTGDLDQAADALARDISSQSTAVTRLIKRAVQAGRDLPFPDALVRNERIYLDELARTEDMNEGIAAFLDKREPRWKHR